MKSTLGTNYAPCSIDGTARIGLSPFQLRGIRLVEGEEGAGGTETGTEETGSEGSQEGAEGAGGTETGAGEGDDKFDAEKAREKIRKANSEAKNLRDRAQKAEQEAAANKDSGERATALEAENLKLRVAVKHGLPENLVKRLTGTTEEELLQDAEELLAMFGKPGTKPPSGAPREQLRGGGNGGDIADPTADLDKFAEDVFRR
ncbi:hypothetical protein [Curtobacterium sp. ISL-83]|uniref:hypothetical protein n=1 Tax=Curtobacterium sp. ISL-83 TaxID=2819145 RepID=UPI001BEA74D8|nr:hypothetical protein [Curtobacterium sp. ISL-83]MBT2502985.1 hypothetical protein [Curtobacterium sp. ISL-83]